MSSLKPLVALLFLLCAIHVARAAAAAAAAAPEEESLLQGGEGGFLEGRQCREDEQLAPGKLPECEPTCRNPRPACLRIFYTSLDFYPCFCKAPLLRCKKSGRCITEEECRKWEELERQQQGLSSSS